MQMHGPLGVGMRWREAGSGGSAVLFVHGFPFSGAIWNEQLANVPAGWCFLAPDLPGFGGSAPLEATLTMDILARELECFLDERELERVVVCGLSMGGYVALALWRLHPERIRALVLADTRAGPDTAEGRLARYERATLARSAGAGAVADAMLPQLLSQETREAHPEVETRLRAIMDTASVEGVAGALDGMAERADSTGLLGTIDVPTLVIVGEQDVIAPVPEAEKLAAGIPGAQLVTIPGAGHVTCMEAAPAFNAALAAFLMGAARS
jgi:pimeloyl-ACP methyl ester carboxylesterase